MTMTLIQLQVFNWWTFSYIILANLFALLFHFLLINDVRMTTFIHQLLSRKTSTLQKSDNTSANIPASVLRCPSLLRMGYAEVVFIQPGGKLDTMWRGAWQRLSTRHQSEMCPLQMVTAAARCSLSHRQKHRNLQRENLQFTEPNILSTE